MYLLAIYRTTFQFIMRHLRFFAGLTILLTASHVFAAYMGSLTGPLFIWFVITYMMHRGVMFGEVSLLRRTRTPRRPHAGWKFAMVCAFMLTLAIMNNTIAVTTYASFDTGIYFNTSLMKQISGWAMGSTLFILLVFFGTALPAAATADKFGTIRSLRRARHTWRPIAIGMLFGPILLALWTHVGFTTLSPHTLDHRSIMQNGAINIAGLPALALLQISHLIQLALFATILCRAYETVAPAEIRQMINMPTGIPKQRIPDLIQNL